MVDLRVPRTLLGIVVGVALGVAGALMQALTRNPLADPGLLGVNAGAAAAIVIGIGLLGVTATSGSVWLAFVGSAVAAVVVFAIGSGGRAGSTPVRLALAGTAVTAALSAVVYGVVLTDQELLRQFNFWTIGALGGRGRDELDAVLPFVLAGLVIAVAIVRGLNALALGDQAARSLGARVGRTRILGGLAITLLCGSATAAAGPIVFLGLVVPHLARAICGPDQRWVLAYSAVLGAVLLLGADVLGRVIAPPGEAQAGIVIAFVGAPVFIALIRRRTLAEL